ncbi:CobW family GTP-binding protein [Advenella mimigardefordensis]|uniref:Putative cobalamin synthesis protein, P47K family n=1 Tax=Advenella mimigardefordensis (strain DSM 17166 / LMG 22922 / DPN7) TaxID=1247726 RepID=W0P9C0_ADVMD|nr:GTP-binding protein [Advenella mimigardefordensis]AHG63449.1 putative cobalamin synthesis protein, P47K family [Advenella mimigardefordensis DPN7]
MTTPVFDSDKRMPVTAVTGFLGSGKTRYINQLLQQPGMANTVVIVNEIGQLGIDQANWSFVQPATILLEGGCLCCQMQGSMSATLQRLFTDALARTIPRFDRIMVETSGLADPSGLRFTLHSDFFLKERFFYNGCIGIVDVVNANRQSAYVEWSRQLVQADLVLLSRTDCVAQDQVPEVVQQISSLTDAPIMPIPSFFENDKALMMLSTLQGSLKPGAGFSNFLTRARDRATHTARQDVEQGTRQAAAHRAGRAPFHDQPQPQSQSQSMLRPIQTHSTIRIITLAFDRPLRRSVFNRVLDAMLSDLGGQLIRAKALLRFVDDPDLYLFNIVHAQRYPAQRLRASQAQDPTAMVLFLDDATGQASVPQADDFYRL